MTPGQLIKKNRQKMKLTQLDLAKALGFDIPQFVCMVENGQSSLPLSLCKKVYTALEISPKDMEKALMKEYQKKIQGYL